MTIADLYRALWRHKISIVAITAILVGVVWYATSRQTPVYEATALVRVDRPIQDPGEIFAVLEANRRLAETYARIAETRTIAQGIQRRVRAVPRDEITVDADALPDVELLTLTASHTSPAIAQRVANAAPAALQGYISDSGSGNDRVVFVERAERPTVPASPNLKLNIAIAVIVGLLLNGAIALLRDLLSDRVPEPAELEELTSTPVLASVPPLQFSRKTPADVSMPQARRQALTDPEAVRRVRS